VVQKVVSKVGLMIESARGLFVGTRNPDEVPASRNTAGSKVFGLHELKLRDASDEFGPVALRTGDADVLTDGRPDTNGRVFVRQVDPLPATVLSIIPQGYLG
jgi:hypothetical protein